MNAAQIEARETGHRSGPERGVEWSKGARSAERPASPRSHRKMTFGSMSPIPTNRRSSVRTVGLSGNDRGGSLPPVFVVWTVDHRSIASPETIWGDKWMRPDNGYRIVSVRLDDATAIKLKHMVIDRRSSLSYEVAKAVRKHISHYRYVKAR